MIDYIKGELVELTPTEAVIETAGIGYSILISLQSFSSLQQAPMYYGFATKDERALFRLLISVSGIGAGTARMMLSSMTSDEIRDAIIASDVNKIKSIKGIGLKTAQRLILELKDKIVKGSGDNMSVIGVKTGLETIEEAATALVMLGFTKANVSKALSAIVKEYPGASVEELIKFALKRL